MQRSLFLIFFLLSFLLQSQVKTAIYQDGKLEERMDFLDSVELKNYVSELNLNSVFEGYFFVGVDSIKILNNERQIFLHRGKKVVSNIPELGKRNLMKSMQGRVRNLGDNGYPFATLSLDSVNVRAGKLTGRIFENKGPFVTNDSAFFYKKIRTNQDFIYQLLNHIPGDAFNESEYRKIDKKIERSSFLSLNRPVDISFQNQKAKVYLDIEEGKSGSFRGVLGLQQQGTGSTSVVGSFDLSVQNLFNSGRELYLRWESFRKNSQELDVTYRHPFIFRSRITPFFNLKLTKQDTVFLRRSTEAGLSVFVSSKIEASLAYSKIAGSLLTTDESILLNSDLADFDSDTYRIELRQGRFSRLNELRSGIAWKAGLGAGSKRIERNLSIDDSFYDTLNLETNAFTLDVAIGVNKRLLDQQTVFFQLESGIIDNNELLNNERYRLGGLHSLRGFDEKIFFTDRYLLARTEFRSFFEKGSFIYVFFDYLTYKNATAGDTPFGTGLGFSLATQSGQFSFALALGKSESQPMGFSNMKIHFGYITRF